MRWREESQPCLCFLAVMEIDDVVAVRSQLQYCKYLGRQVYSSER